MPGWRRRLTQLVRRASIPCGPDADASRGCLALFLSPAAPHVSSSPADIPALGPRRPPRPASASPRSWKEEKSLHPPPSFVLLPDRPAVVTDCAAATAPTLVLVDHLRTGILISIRSTPTLRHCRVRPPQKPGHLSTPSRRGQEQPHPSTASTLHRILSLSPDQSVVFDLAFLSFCIVLLSLPSDARATSIAPPQDKKR